jgi:uncharacterized protein (DUF1330 family)
MTAFAISEFTILDEALMARYRELSEASIARYGGRYVVRGRAVEALEGVWPPEQGIVVIEFPSLERAREWYGSPEYARALEIRGQALVRRLILVDAGEAAQG